MPTEIEHKYIVTDSSYKDLSDESYLITQGYLSRRIDASVRVRIISDKAYLTIKGKTNFDQRDEYEYEIPYADAQEMLKMCEGKIISKTRYLVKYAGHKWEIDEFHGELAPMVMAEIELSYQGEDYLIPPFVGEEVTGNPMYYNSNL